MPGSRALISTAAKRLSFDLQRTPKPEIHPTPLDSSQQTQFQLNFKYLCKSNSTRKRVRETERESWPGQKATGTKADADQNNYNMA